MMSKMMEISCLVHQTLHPTNSSIQLGQFMLFLILLHKAQELALICDVDELQDQMMKPLAQFTKYLLVIDDISQNVKLAIIIFLFGFHFVLVLFFIFQIFAKLKQTVYSRIFQLIITNYPLCIQIPAAYLSLEFLINRTEICANSSFCTQNNTPIFYLLSIINILIIQILQAAHLFFCRSDTLLNDNIIYKLHFNPIFEIFIKCLELLLILFAALRVTLLFRFLIFLFLCFTQIGFCLIRVNQPNQLLILLFKLGIGLAIGANRNIYELCYFVSFLILLAFQIRERIINIYATKNDQKNLLTISIIEECYQIDVQARYRLILEIVKYKHNCRKCRTSRQIVECLLRSLSNSEHCQDLHVILYCNYISNKIPLKALIRVMLLKTSDFYYSCCASNLRYDLYKRSQQFQNQVTQRNQVKNVEHTNSLSVSQVYQTSHSAQMLFPLFIEVIQLKIEFFNKLINGYYDIHHYLDFTISMSKLMLKCKQVIEDRFDLEESRLKKSDQNDVLSMKVLQIFYCAIYQNSYQAFSLEKAIEELLKNERFKQIESLDNISLVQNRLYIFKTSLVNKRGDLIQINRGQLAAFLDESQDNVQNVQHISQLMPQFLSSIHDNLMENYIQNGYSKLMIQAEQSFYQDLKGYLIPCTLNLFNYYNGNDDFIMNMIITKQTQNQDVILFGIDGKILGITQSCYQNLSQDNMSQQKTEQLTRTGLIQYYMPQITQQVDYLRRQIMTSQNYLLNNLKSLWNSSQHHFNLHTTLSLLAQFQSAQKQLGNQNFSSYKSQIYSRYTSQSETKQTNQYDIGLIDQQILNEIVLDNQLLIMLHPDVQSHVEKQLSYQTAAVNEDQIQLQYSLQYKALKYKRGCYSYFIITFKEYNKVNQNKSMSQYQSAPLSSQVPSDLVQTLENTVDQINDFGECKNDELIKRLEGQNHLTPLQNHDSYFNASLNQSLQNQNKSYLADRFIQSSDRAQLDETNRQIGQQPLFVKPNVKEDPSMEADQIELEMRNIFFKMKKAQFDEDDEQDVEKEKEKQPSKSQSAQKQSNILKKFISVKQMKQNIGADFASNPSRTSTNSTSKQSLLIVQQIYHNKQLITPLKKIIVIHIAVAIGIMVSNALNVNLIDENLTEQTNQVANLRQPQNINYFFTSCYCQLYFNLLVQNDLIELSPYMYERNQVTADNMFQYGRQVMNQLAIDVNQQAAQRGFHNFEATVFEEGIYKKTKQSFYQFYTIMYEQIELMWRLNQGKEIKDKDYSAIKTNSFLRQNLVQMIIFHDDLIVSNIEETIAKQQDIKSYFMGVMVAELFSIIVVIIFQLKFWLFIDTITKSILFLVSRLNEDQAYDQISQLKSIKDVLQDSNLNLWRTFNFASTTFEQKIVKKQKEFQSNISNLNKSISAKQQQHSYKTSTALYARIQQTKFIKRWNVCITFFMAIVWSLYLMTGYLIHMGRNDDFQPSLVIALRFLQFRHNLDSAALFAGLIKSENLIQDNDIGMINQSLIIEGYKQFKGQVPLIINEVLDVIVKKAQANNEKSIFDTILSDDLCLQKSSSLDMCFVQNIKLPYTEKDKYYSLIQSGALGYTASWDSFANQEYVYELTHLTYNNEDLLANKLLVNSQLFQNLILQYFTDIQDTMRTFLVLFQIDNAEIASSISALIQYYYFGLGISLFLLFCLTCAAWVLQAQKSANCVQQVLVLLSLDQILNPNIRSQAKEIHNNLY